MYLTFVSFVLLTLTSTLGASAGTAEEKAFGDQVVGNHTLNEESITEKGAVREELLREVGVALGGVNAVGELGNDISEIEKVLLPIIVSSPENKFGRLEDAESRYVLHRYFMQQHGWDMRTFMSSNKADDEVTCLFDFGRPVPFAVQAALEKRVADRGASIVELSIFVALLEHLVRDEIPSKVEAAYRTMEVSRTDLLDERQATMLIDFHMAMQISALDPSKISPQKVMVLLERMPKAYTGWSYALELFRSVQEEEAGGATEYSFADIVRIITRLEGEKLSHLQNHQCQAMKNKLIPLEVPGSGRVRLPEFYSSALTDSNPEFMESLDYLRQLGAVDERDGEPQVVISNYLDGPSNCIAASNYYSVCCLDECVELFMDLEKTLKKSAATPEEILSVVKGLSTASTPELSLSQTQINKLREIAQGNVGLIQLHGPAFEQWMHQTFPRECTDTALTGPAHFMTLDEWASTSGKSVAATVEEARRVVEEAKAAAARNGTAASVDPVAVENNAGFSGDEQSEDDETESSSDVEDVDGTGDADSTVVKTVEELRAAREFEKSVSPWVPARRWVAFLLVAVLVPAKMFWDVYTNHFTKLSKDGLVKIKQPEMADLEASIVMDRV